MDLLFWSIVVSFTNMFSIEFTPKVSRHRLLNTLKLRLNYTRLVLTSWTLYFNFFYYRFYRLFWNTYEETGK